MHRVQHLISVILAGVILRSMFWNISVLYVLNWWAFLLLLGMFFLIADVAVEKLIQFFKQQPHNP
jgi:hypothetical protein